MKQNSFYSHLAASHKQGKKRLAILLDPDKINPVNGLDFVDRLPESDYLFVGGSRVESGKTDEVVKAIKAKTRLPIILFPGNINQITAHADSILYLSLMSGDNPEYLTGQQIKAVPYIQKTALEVVPTAYILIDGGQQSSVERESKTRSIPQTDVERIVHTCMAAEYSGKQLIYLEAGSGAKHTVSEEIIKRVKLNTNLPLIVGGGIRSEDQMNTIYNAGADLIVMGTVFEEKNIV